MTEAPSSDPHGAADRIVGGRFLPDAPAAILPLVMREADRLAIVPRPTVHEAARHPALVYLAGLAPGSRRTMRHALDVIASLLTGGRADHQTLPWHRLDYAHAAAVRAALAAQYAPATVNKQLAAFRGVVSAAWRLGYMTADVRARVVDVKSVRGSGAPPAGRAISRAEMRALLEACAADPTAAGARDAAILALCYGAGLRRAEAARIDLAHVDPETGTVGVKGKGSKWRVTYARGGAADVLRVWCARRGSTPGRFLLPVTQRGAVVYTRQLRGQPEAPAGVGEQAIYLRLQARAIEAGVKPFTPHDCRRTFAGDLIDAGADLNSVKELLGHATIQTTVQYDRRGERAKAATADLLHFPHVRFASAPATPVSPAAPGGGA